MLKTAPKIDVIVSNYTWKTPTHCCTDQFSTKNSARPRLRLCSAVYYSEASLCEYGIAVYQHVSLGSLITAIWFHFVDNLIIRVTWLFTRGVL